MGDALLRANNDESSQAADEVKVWSFHSNNEDLSIAVIFAIL
jgi:hypothetical protein